MKFDTDPTIKFWDTSDDVDLRWTEPGEALDDAIQWSELDDLNSPESVAVTLRGLRQMDPSVRRGRLTEELLDWLHEECGDPEGGVSKVTDSMLEAEDAFIEAVLKEYEPYWCEEVVRYEVNLREWAKLERPEILDKNGQFKEV